MELVVDEARSARRKGSPILRGALGIRHVGGLIVAFQERYPGIAVDLSLTDERIDLVREGVDVALRLGPLADSSMKLRAPGTSGRVLVGSPDFWSGTSGRRSLAGSPRWKASACRTSPEATCCIWKARTANAIA